MDWLGRDYPTWMTLTTGQFDDSMQAAEDNVTDDVGMLMWRNGAPFMYTQARMIRSTTSSNAAVIVVEVIRAPVREHTTRAGTVCKRTAPLAAAMLSCATSTDT